ncbi:hypothetical protein LDENG_00222880 [Lucifuga dentata]|nr:hypothetical protein LDENG_00222880 [Lucifuga dentata]
MQDFPAFFCGLIFCCRTCLSWTNLLVISLVITSAFCLQLRFLSLCLDSPSVCLCVSALSSLLICLLLCWIVDSIKELNQSVLYCVLHLGPNHTCYTDQNETRQKSELKL